MTIFPIVYNERGYSKVVTAFLTEADAVMYCDSMNAINKRGECDVNYTVDRPVEVQERVIGYRYEVDVIIREEKSSFCWTFHDKAVHYDIVLRFLDNVETALDCIRAVNVDKTPSGFTFEITSKHELCDSVGLANNQGTISDDKLHFIIGDLIKQYC